MKHPTFLSGVAVAFVVSSIGSVLFTALTTLFPGSTAMRLLIAGIGFTYLVYLLTRSRDQVGRITVVIVWLVTATLVWFMAPSLIFYLMIHISLIWLIRSLYFYSSVLSSLADLGLNGMSLAAVVWATVQTGSVFLSIWCFFLVQALFVTIPPHLSRKAMKGQPEPSEEDRFHRAYRAAESALRRLSSV